MKLYSNENNPAALKVVIASCIAGNKVTLEIVPEESSSCLEGCPCWNCHREQDFTSNAAVWFLLPPDSSTVDEWLQLKATQIAPLLSQGAGKLAAVQPLLLELLAKAVETLPHLDK